MRTTVVGHIISSIFILVIGSAWGGYFTPSQRIVGDVLPLAMLDSTDKDSPNIKLKYPINDNSLTPFNEQSSPFNLEDPDNIKRELIYDPETGNYYYKQEMGDNLKYRPENYMTLDEFLDYDLNKGIKNYWQSKVATENEFNKKNGFEVPPLKIESEIFDRIFGGNTIDIRPSGSAELIFGVNTSRTDNPALPLRQRKISVFDFQQRIQLNVIGNIGEKLRITTNYNTEATFDFENQIKVDYTGNEDEIIQKIEAGNVSLPLQSSLITGSQSLFGLKTQLKFGRLTVTTIASQQRGQKKQLEVKGGAQINEFEIRIDRYEQNKHFLLSHFFRDKYDEASANPPFVNSGINITKIEVWVTNTNNIAVNTRDIIAFQDLGENNRQKLFNGSGTVNVNASFLAADNEANSLYGMVRANTGTRNFLNASNVLDAMGFEPRVDYHRVGLARRLEQTEYFFHPQLGFISTNQELQPNQVLGVAYQYTFRGRTYQVGEFSTDIPEGQPLFLKMLKSTQLNTTFPMWDLMMKNVYSLGAYQVQPKDFRLDIWYLDAQKGFETNFLPEGPPDVNGRPLIQVVGLDKLDMNNNPRPDGIFDFIALGDQRVATINPANGRIYFPTLEPFGRTLRERLGNPTLGARYGFDSLYTNTQINAQVKFPEQNRFTIKGQYQSSSSNEIALGALNVPEGSVRVTAGGRTLQENVDYTVDYTLGRVKIINQGLMESGTAINIEMESNAFFNIQTKTLLGSRFDYKISEDFMLGGTVMNMTERPLTQKINVGDEPMSNTIWGVDGTYRTESPFLTRLIDKIPFIDTKEKSSIQVSGEFAQLVPGHNRAIGRNGNAYVDDFEGSQSTIDLRSVQMWSLASVPQGLPSLFPEGRLKNDLGAGFNRARLSWYNIDPLFWDNDRRAPDHIRNDAAMRSNHFMRQIPLQEVFPNRQEANFQLRRLFTLDLAFYPSEKGPYNYDVTGFSPQSGERVGHGVDPNGLLNNPDQRWAGVQREITQQDFQDANIEYIQFWVMDPFNEDYEQLTGTNFDQGELYFNLGTISEDVQKDGQLFYENLLSTEARPVEDIANEAYITPFGRFTPGQSYVFGFDNNPDARQFQDVGYDGLRDVEERAFFSNYVQQLQTVAPNANPDLINDPSQDNFRFYRNDQFDAQEADILTRYKYFNGPDGNSPISGLDGDAAVGTTRPNFEDINRDNNLEEAESYWQYKVNISPNQVNPNNIGNNYIADVMTTTAKTEDGRDRSINWYLFRIPIDEGVPINNIQDFRSIRFMRMYMRGFSNPVVLRFARLELVRGEWRRFDGNLEMPGDYIHEDESTEFVLQAVNIEENSNRQPVNYVLPPDIEREINVGTTNLQQLNEQALAALVCDLKDGDARAAFRNLNLDIRSYGKLKMFVHGNARSETNEIQNGDLTVFIRLGTDFNQNYYEYEIPLVLTPAGQYSNLSENARRQVWPEANNMEVDFGILQAAKTARNRAAITNPQQVNNRVRYAYRDGKATVYVVGNPNLSQVKTIMLGVRNPKRIPGSTADDGMPKCAEVWFNELRLSDFDDRAGWAAIAQMNAQLADFASVSMAASMSTPGWGSLESKVSERQRETRQQIDLSANVELGKFFPKETGIKIPMYVGYTEFVGKPMFAPLSPDTEFDQFLRDSYPSEDLQDSVRRVQETRHIRKSVNFTNVRKEKMNPQSKPKFYDISNFSTTVGYAEDFRRDFNIEYNTTKTYRGGFNYNYGLTPKNYQPFAKMKPFRTSKNLKFIRDFNFYLMPRQISFQTEMNRMYNETKIRNNQPGIMAETLPFYNKTFDWNRMYNLRWDLTRSLKMDFQASNSTLVQEPEGPVNQKFFREEYEMWKDSVRTNIQNMGTNMRYNHNINLNYTIPFNKFPLLDFMNGNARYSGTYNWDRAPFAADSLGNTIQNSQQIQLTGSFNMTTLYNKSKFLREINRKALRGGNQRGDNQRGNTGRGGSVQNQNDSTNKKDKDPNKLTFIEHVVKPLMMFKNASLSYSVNQGIMLPGYKPTHNLMGMDQNFDAPGFGFIMGQQRGFGENKEDFIDYAIRRGWHVQEETFNQMYSQTYSERANYRVNLEPFKDMRIELTGNWDIGQNFSVYSRWYDTLILEDEIRYNTYFQESPMTTGNFNISYLPIRTAFFRDNEDYVNQAFVNFSDYRQVISRRLSENNPNSVGLYRADTASAPPRGTYYDGFGPTQQEVLVPAFMAAYSGKDPEKISLSPFARIPMPNWRLTYTGLTKIDFFKKYFKSVTVGHAYQSTFSIASFQSNILYKDDNGNGFTDIRDPILGSNFVSQYEYQTVNIREALSPLMNFDFTWNNSLITRVEYRVDRTMSLSMINAQVTEVRGSEIIVGLGYTFTKIKLPFMLPSQQAKSESDIRTRADFSIRDNRTLLRKLDTDIRPNEPTGGQRIISLKLTADYALNSRLNIRLFYDRVLNRPVISLAFPTSNTNAGLSIRFTIAG